MLLSERVPRGSTVEKQRRSVRPMVVQRGDGCLSLILRDPTGGSPEEAPLAQRRASKEEEKRDLGKG